MNVAEASTPQKKNRRGYGSCDRFRRQLKAAGAFTYAEYLQSDHWRELKASCVPRRTWQGKPVCELCLGRVGPFELHHKKYSRIGCEPPKHLILICRACHQWIHGWHQRSGETLGKITRRVAILARARKECGCAKNGFQLVPNKNNAPSARALGQVR